MECFIGLWGREVEGVQHLYAVNPKRTDYAGFSDHVDSSESRFGRRQMEIWANKETTATSRTI
jgi:hypothetical protein